MWQSLGRNLKGFITAVCVLAFLVCAGEVGLRVDRYRSAIQGQPAAASENLPIEEQLVAPSMTTWLEILPGAKASIKSPDTGELIAIQTSSFGTRGPEPLIPKPHGTLRVLCLGDETTFAAEVSTAETYAAQLEQLLRNQLRTRVEVINAGLPGGCPRTAALQLRHRLAALQPDLVVLHFGMSDVTEDAAIRRFVSVNRQGDPLLGVHPATKKACQLKKPRLSDEFMIVDLAQRQLTQLWDREMPAADESLVIRRQLFRWCVDNAPEMESEIASALSPIATIRQLCDANNARLLVATTPMPWQISRDASNTREARAVYGVAKSAIWSSEAPFQRLAAYCREQEINCVITLRSFQNAEDPTKLYLQHSPGLSADGHRLYAEILARSITGQVTNPDEEHESHTIVPSKGEQLEWAR